eukprot:snap_masked-scaffold_2-processed-gene-3.13-mRNA-1 protein AED:1.00 eAED:1.00 QI:0/-1/0/0/-1/1/1/0/278
MKADNDSGFSKKRGLRWFSSLSSVGTDTSSELKTRKKSTTKRRAQKKKKKSLIGLLRIILLFFWGSFVLWFLLSSIVVTLKFDFKLTSMGKARNFPQIFSQRLKISSDEPESDADLFSYSDSELEQKLTTTAKKRVTREEETALACKEYDCFEKCAEKLTLKCVSSESCFKAKSKECRRKCRKARCDKRCLLEPSLGYVERGMKLEACKDKCPKYGAEKCIEKCEFEFQPCKQKCRSYISHKFFCHDGRSTRSIFDQEALVVKKTNKQLGKKVENVEI